MGRRGACPAPGASGRRRRLRARTGSGASRAITFARMGGAHRVPRPVVGPHPRTVAAALGCCLIALQGCGDSPVQRGFNSRELLQIRVDSSIHSYGFLGNTWVYTKALDQAGSVLEYWSLDLDSGAVTDLGLRPPDQVFVPPDPRYSCAWTDGPLFTVTISDAQTGKKTIIDRISGVSFPCPTVSNPNVVAWRSDDSGNLAIWSGPYDQLAVVPLDLTIHRLVERVLSVADVPPGAPARVQAWVLGSRPPADKDSAGAYSIDLGDYTVTELVPPVPGFAAWAVGARTEGPLDSRSLSLSTTLTGAGAGHLAYQRLMSDGLATVFVGPFPANPTELALFRPAEKAALLRPGLVLTAPPGGPLPAVWQQNGDSIGENNVLLAWNDVPGELATCPSPFAVEAIANLDPSGTWLGFTSKPHDWVTPTPGPLLLMGPRSCLSLAAADVTSFSFSPDGLATVWLQQPPGGIGTLWTAGVDGLSPRKLGAGTLSNNIAGPPDPPRFVGPAELEFKLGTDLVSIDVHDDPVRMHYLAERTFGSPIDLGGYVVTGCDNSRQDAAGTLALVDRSTGHKRVISADVAWYSLVGPASPSPSPAPVVLGDGESAKILYMVRGRFASSRDGIWIATITANDLL